MSYGDAGDQVLDKVLFQIVLGDPVKNGQALEQVVLHAAAARPIVLYHVVDGALERIVRLGLREVERLFQRLLRVNDGHHVTLI